MIRCRVLGPIAVSGARGWATPHARLRRRSLAVLAFASGQTVDADRIADAVWGAHVPVSARKVVQNHVLVLRRELGPDLIRTRPDGYLLALERNETDCARFEELADAGGSASRRGRHRAATDLFEAALAEWHGDPYVDLADWPPAYGEINRLTELRHTVVEARLEGLLASGEHSAAAAELEAVVAEAPLRERGWELLMLALYRSGRQAEALRAFQRVRDVLREQLGVTPGGELRRLEAAILVHDPALEWRYPSDTRPASPRGTPADAVTTYRGYLTRHAADGPSLRDQCELLVRLAEAEYLASDPLHRSTTVAAARLADHVGEPALLVRSTLAGSRQIEAAQLGVDPERVAMLRRALESADAPCDRARLLSGLASEMNSSSDHGERRSLTDQALALARQAGDDVTLHHVLTGRFASICAPDTLAERLANTEEGLALVERLDDPRLRWAALCNRATVCLEAGDGSESEQMAQAAAEIALELGYPAMLWRTQVVHARQLTMKGELDAAAEEIRRARDAGRVAGESADYLFAGQLYTIRWHQNRLAEIAGRLSSMRLERPLDRAFACHAYAHLARERDARRLLTGLAARGFADVPYDGYWLTVMSLVADAAICVDATDVIEEVHDLLDPWRDQVVVTASICLGSVSHYLGMLARGLGRSTDAEVAFARAAGIHDRIGAPLWGARTRQEQRRVASMSRT